MITYAQAKDCKVVYDLLCDQMERTFDYEAFVPAYEKYIQDERITPYVYEKDGAIVGFLFLRIDFQLHHMGNVAEIMELAVVRACRYSDVEREMIREAIQNAREHHCDCIEVCTRRSNEKAHRFYERAGFNKSHYKLKMPLKY